MTQYTPSRRVRHSSGQSGSLRPFLQWRVPNRTERMNAHRLMRLLRHDKNVIARVVGSIGKRDELRAQSIGTRYYFEACLLAYDERLRVEGREKLYDRFLADLHYENRGLNVESELYVVWRQLVAQFHSKPEHAIPPSVRLLVGGLVDQSEPQLRRAVAVLLDDDVPFRRVGQVPRERLHTLRHQVVRQWAEANGFDKKEDLALVERIIKDDVNHRLGAEPAESFARLDPSAVPLATDLAAKAGFAGDQRFAFYVFRCLQRIAAYAVEGRVQWRSEWLRGTKANPRAIAGTSKLQAELGRLLHAHVLEVEQGHSGANATATTYRVRIELPSGSVDHHRAASELGVELDAKNIPRRA